MKTNTTHFIFTSFPFPKDLNTQGLYNIYEEGSGNAAGIEFRQVSVYGM